MTHPHNHGAPWAGQIILDELAKAERPAPRLVDREAPMVIDAEFITPQGAADDLERRNNLASAVEDLVLLLAAIALGFALAGGFLAWLAGGV